MGAGSSSKKQTSSGQTASTPVTSPTQNAIVPNGSLQNGTVVYGPGNMAVGGGYIPMLYRTPQGYSYMVPTAYYQPQMLQQEPLKLPPKNPPARPPKTTKDEVFVAGRYRDIDGFAINAPASLLTGTFDHLVWFLTRSNENWDDICKLRAIFIWVTSIDVYNLQVQGVPPIQSPLEYFNKMKNNIGNHANLMYNLCHLAGLPCVIINGMNKSTAYEVGGKVDRKKMGAQWNAVFVNGDWRFVDAFWASSCVVGQKTGEWTLVDSDGNVTNEDEQMSEGQTLHRINEFYFMPDPDKLVWTHFPDEIQWQLLDNPVTLKEFEDHVYIRERFYQVGMKLLPNSQDKCVISSSEGESEIVFSMPGKQS